MGKKIKSNSIVKPLAGEGASDKLDAWLELAELAPMVAIEAALTLMESRKIEARERGMNLGLSVIAALGPKARGSTRLAEYCSRMLEGEWVQAKQFIGQAGLILKKLAPLIVGRIGVDRSMQIELELPGFCSSLTSNQLAKHDGKLCGCLRAQGLIEPAKVYDTLLNVAWLVTSLKGSGPLGPSEQKYMDEALVFSKRAIAEFPLLEREAWTIFWNKKSRSDEHYLNVGLAKITVSVDPFEDLPAPDELESGQRVALQHLVNEIKNGSNRELGQHLGLYLSRASVATIDKLSSGRFYQSENWTVKFTSRSDQLLFEPANASAKILQMLQPKPVDTWFQASETDLAKKKAFAARQVQACLGLAEGLSKGGAVAPIFYLVIDLDDSNRRVHVNTGGYVDQSAKFQRENWPSNMPCQLGPALMLASCGASPSDPALQWMVKGTDKRERVALSEWLDVIRHLPGSFSNAIEHAEAQIVIDALDLSSSVVVSPTTKPSKLRI